MVPDNHHRTNSPNLPTVIVRHLLYIVVNLDIHSVSFTFKNVPQDLKSQFVQFVLC